MVRRLLFSVRLSFYQPFMSQTITFFISDLRGGGAERALVKIANGMSRRGHRVSILLGVREGKYLDEVDPAIPIEVLGTTHPLKTIFGLRDYLKVHRPDILCAFLNQPSVFSVIAKRLAKVDTRVVISLRSILSLEAKYATSMKLKVMPGFMKIFGPRADGIICVSQASKDDFCRMTGVRAERVDVAYNAIIDEQLLSSVGKRADHPWFGEGEPPVVLGVGRLTAIKDFPTLIRAFAEVRKVRPARLMILGEGEERENLSALIQELGLGEDAQLAGFVSNPFPYMAAAKVVCLTSLYEGLPGVLVQALAMGTPVVATNSEGGSAEAVEGGKLGKLVPIRDVEALAQAICQVLDGDYPNVNLMDLQKFTIDDATRGFEQCLLANSGERTSA